MRFLRILSVERWNPQRFSVSVSVNPFVQWCDYGGTSLYPPPLLWPACAQKWWLNLSAWTTELGVLRIISVWTDWLLLFERLWKEKNISVMCELRVSQQLCSLNTSVTSDIQSIFQQLIIVAPPTHTHPAHSALFHSVAFTHSFSLFLFSLFFFSDAGALPQHSGMQAASLTRWRCMMTTWHSWCCHPDQTASVHSAASHSEPSRNEFERRARRSQRKSVPKMTRTHRNLMAIWRQGKSCPSYTGMCPLNLCPLLSRTWIHITKTKKWVWSLIGPQEEAGRGKFVLTDGGLVPGAVTMATHSLHNYPMTLHN